MTHQFWAAALFLLSLWACQPTAEKIDTRTPGPDEDYLITISTRHGEMKAILFEETPQHRDNFVKLARSKFYDSTLFHRVMPGFMAQGGDPSSKNAAPGTRLGQGDPGYSIPAEINPKLFHRKGALAAARKPDLVNPNKESNGSQFYIVEGRPFDEEELRKIRIDYNKLYSFFLQLIQDPANQEYRSQYERGQKEGDEVLIEILLGYKPMLEEQFGEKVDLPLPEAEIKAYTTEGGTPNLDGAYTVFGQVVAGLDLISLLTAEPADPANRPTQDLPMTVKVEILPKKEISEKYGVKYEKNQNTN